MGDAWTGNTRWSPEVQEGFKNVASTIMGKEAYQRLVNWEGIGKEIVNEAKSAIMIKSLVMPAINIASDTVQMLGRGVPITDIVRGTPKKITEVAAYVRGRMRKLEAEAELYVSQGKKDFQAQARLKTELQSNRRHEQTSFNIAAYSER